MSAEKLLSSTGETVAYAQIYLEKKVEYLQLELAKRTAKTTSGLVTLAIIAFLVFMVMIFFSIGIAFLLGSMWNSYGLAFLAVTGFYVLLAALVFFFKKQIITNPISAIIVKSMFD